MVNFALQQKSIVSLGWCTGSLVHSFRLGSNFFWWSFCHQKNISEQNVGWGLHNDCKLLSQIVFFCRLPGTWKIVFSSIISGKWCQCHYNPIPAFAVSTGYMHLVVFHVPRRINNGVHVAIELPFIGIYRYFLST